MGYSVRPATLDDLGLLTRWQSEPHVARWWSAEPVFDAASLADPRVVRWIGLLDGAPIAYLQDYDVHGWGGHHLDGLPPKSRGIDQFIGPPDRIGRGHGTALIGARLRALFAGGAPAIGTDPHPDNARAIAVYRKLGFRPEAGPVETPWGRVQRMVARP